MAKAIRAGIFNDLGSGSNVDVCIIRKDGVDYRRNMEFLQVCHRTASVMLDSMRCVSFDPIQLPYAEIGTVHALSSRVVISPLQDKTYARVKPVQHPPGTAGEISWWQPSSLYKSIMFLHVPVPKVPVDRADLPTCRCHP